MEINNTFTPLTNDDDVLKFNKDTFTVGRLRELVTEELNRKISKYIQIDNKDTNMRDFWDQLLIAPSFSVKTNSFNTKYCTPCEILIIGSKGWQKGELIIEGNFNEKWELQVSLEFSPDEPPLSASPLDEIRQSEEYQKLLQAKLTSD